tara:strand:- start:1584 stop:2564 length:981 start_codon:yes stop_codon:yes gene_type:complete
MGQFKPMVKMETTEPSVILKLKKGGHVKNPKMKAEDNGTGYKKMADGGTMGMLSSTPALVGRPAVNAPVRAPGKPSMAARRKAMRPNPMVARSPMAPPMKKGGEAHEDEAQDRAMIKKAMAGKKFATGGVVMGQGGYKTGGVAKGNAGGYAKGGGIEGNVSGTPAGVSGTKTGSVKLGNAGGFRKGGAAKKFADGGAVQDDGRAVKMPQGNKRPSTPVSINQLSGTFKKGGKVKKFSTGGLGETEQRLLREAQEEKLDRKGREAFENVPKVQKELDEAMNPMSMAGEMFSKVKKMFSPSKVEVPKGSVTKTEKSVTVAPKKRGGAC